MVLRYEDNDELCHKPSGDPWWQESVAFGADPVPTLVGAVVSDGYSRTSARAR
jgi:hypothetical protein